MQFVLIQIRFCILQVQFCKHYTVQFQLSVWNVVDEHQKRVVKDLHPFYGGGSTLRLPAVFHVS